MTFDLCVSEEKVKDYRYYLRMWAKEKDPKTETIKDLPRMNQVRGHRGSGVNLSQPLFSLRKATLGLSRGAK